MGIRAALLRTDATMTARRELGIATGHRGTVHRLRRARKGSAAVTSIIRTVRRLALQALRRFVGAHRVMGGTSIAMATV